MKLTLGNGRCIENPSAEQVEAALRGLPGGRDSFAILAAGEQTYLQVSGGPEAGFVLEYREGSPPRQFRCSDPRLPLERSVAAFLSYLRGESDYKSELAWQMERPGPGRWSRAAWVVLGVLFAVAASVYRCGT